MFDSFIVSTQRTNTFLSRLVEECRVLFDVNNDGKIEMQEFLHYFMHSNEYFQE